MPEDKGSRRHCWECLRRSLVCDFTRPKCNRCTASGTECPGYGDKKPTRIKWLPPGQAKSRNRKPKGNPSSKTDKAATDVSLTKTCESMIHPEPTTDLHAMIQAVQYYNTCVYPDLLHTFDVLRGTFVYKITPTLFQKGVSRPDYVRLSIVCMAISHRLNRTRDNLDSHTLCTLRKTFLHYRGLIISSLNNDVGAENKRTQDVVLAGIITLLLADAQEGNLHYRRWHLQGLQKLILLRGGVRSMGESEAVKSFLLCYAFIIVIGDTTTPVHEVFMGGSQLRDLEFILTKYAGTNFSFSTFPTPLFAELIRVNHLRVKASKPDAAEEANLICEAYEIIGRIDGFVPENWAQSKPSSHEDWLVIGTVYHAAVTLYSICSLQSLSMIPMSNFMNERRTTQRQLLYVLLYKALLWPKFKTHLFWPLVVLGMEAVNGDDTLRAFVQEQLAEQSRWMGTSVPLVAKDAVERFWLSGKTQWEDCFDKPYGLSKDYIAICLRSPSQTLFPNHIHSNIEMLLPSLFFLAGAPLALAKCKCTPTDDCWPKASAWDTLNTTINGRLIHNEPIARPCYQGAGYSKELCKDISSNWTANSWLATSPVGYSYPAIESCPVINATIGAGRYPQCDLGNYPVYTINATQSSDIAVGIKFAKDHNVRLVIKNTGHDISQRSQGYGSLSIWIKYLKDGLSFQDQYDPSDRSCQTDYTGPAIKIGGGYVWEDLYKFAYDHGSIVVGGDDRTVGTLGGFLQGGGHGPASHEFGLGADQVLEYEAVLASGELITANACQYPDLFTALRGGGGGTYGIATSATVKAHPDRVALGHELTIAALNGTGDIVNITADIMASYPAVVEEGFSGTAIFAHGDRGLVYSHPLVKLLENNSASAIAKAKDVMNQQIVDKWLPYNGTSLFIKSEFKVFDSFLSWYNSHRHLSDGQNRPMMASRFFDKNSLASQNNMKSLLETLISGQGNQTSTKSATLFNLVAGGKVLEPQPYTSVNPAWRKTYVVMQQIDFWPDNAGYEEISQVKEDLTFKKLKAMKDFAPGMGTYGNEADPYDPDWKNDWWGDMYDELLMVKKKYDPEDVFWCWRCVGNDAWAESTGAGLYGPLCSTH
ncbi:hypothetical protein V492_02933 [Pseudogymnoascus sp. VKM F-4246]|nr:hypothetical protein V492_02933 [Pseudogymnoascus sp. VKM F-4246]